MTAKEFQEKHSKVQTRKSNRHEEDDIQTACVGWFREHYPDLAPLLFHPNNEAFFGGYCRTPEERAIKGRRAKEKGVTPGVADLILLYPSVPYHGLCIEMKTSKGRQEDVQKDWQKAVEKRFYRYEIIRNVEDFKTLIQQYTRTEPKDHEAAMLEKIFGKPVNVHKR